MLRDEGMMRGQPLPKPVLWGIGEGGRVEEESLPPTPPHPPAGLGRHPLARFSRGFDFIAG